MRIAEKRKYLRNTSCQQHLFYLFVLILNTITQYHLLTKLNFVLSCEKSLAKNNDLGRIFCKFQNYCEICKLTSFFKSNNFVNRLVLTFFLKNLFS